MFPLVTIFVIATKDYLRYATQLVDSASRLGSIDFRIQFIVLTDNLEEASRIPKTQNIKEISIQKIDSLGWPEATLYRFRLMVDHWSAVKGSIVMYMDADTEFVSNFSYSDLVSNVNASSSGMVLVRHPGYFKSFFFLIPLIKSRLGPWESNKNSLAFVPIFQRGHYVCGGVYWGSSNSFFQMSSHLSRNISKDEANQIKAKHNDESHLNNWLSQNSSSVVTPIWAFASGYRNLKALKPIIEVVHKPDDFERSPT